MQVVAVGWNYEEGRHRLENWTSRLLLQRFELSRELSQGWKSSVFVHLEAKDKNVLIILRVRSHVSVGQKKTGSRRRGLNLQIEGF